MVHTKMAGMDLFLTELGLLKVVCLGLRPRTRPRPNPNVKVFG